MIRLLFVDDEPLVLKGLERSLRGLRPAWHGTYASGAAAAVAALERDPYDVIISDVGMPEMDGITLLRLVRERYPHIARLILSGEARNTDRMRGLLEIHQWLAKPTPVREVIAVIEATVSRRATVEDPDALAAMTAVTCLPSPLAFYRATARAVENNAPLAELIALVEADIGMTTKLIQLVNGAFFGPAKRITSVRLAAETLGVARVRAMLTAAEVCFHPDVDTLTAQATFTAELARSFAVEHPDDAFLAGLLHDVGSLTPAADGDVSSALLGTWGLPAEVIDAVAFHRDPERAPDPHEPRLGAVALATALATELRAPATSPAIVASRASALGLDPAACRAQARSLASTVTSRG